MVTVHQGDLEFFGEERISQIAWWRYKFLQGVLGSLVVTKTFLEVKLVDLEFQSCFQVILKKLPDCPFHLNFLLTANLQPGCDMTKKSLGWQGLQMHGNSVQIFRSCCSFGMKVKRLFRQFPQQPWKLIPWWEEVLLLYSIFLGINHLQSICRKQCVLLQSCKMLRVRISNNSFVLKNHSNLWQLWWPTHHSL